MISLCRLRAFAFSTIVAGLWSVSSATSAENLLAAPPAPGSLPAAWLPSSSVIVVHSPKPDTFLDLVLDEQLLGQVKIEKGPAAALNGIARYLQTQVGSDWKTALRRSMRNGFTFAVGPGGATILIARAEDAAFLEKLNGVFTKTSWWEKPDRVSQTTHAGVTCWTVNGGKEYHAICGDHLILSNQLPALQRVLELRAGTASPSESLSGQGEFESSQRSARNDAALVAFLAPGLVNALPLFKRSPDASQQPLGVLLAGRNLQAAKAAPKPDWLPIEFDVKGRTLSVRIADSRLAGQALPFAAPPGGDGVWPNLQVPRQMAALSVWRDLRGFYAAKDTLFPERTSELILFENLMGIYFSGRDLTEDILGALDPHVRLVVAEQAYDPQAGTPTVKVPAFAAIFRMRDPQRFALISEEAWQKAIGLINITRGQKAQSGLLIDKVEFGGVRYTCASFSAAEEPDRKKLDIRFNVQPSIARAGEFLILSSTQQLTNDLIEALRAPQPPLVASNGLVELDGSRLASFLLENREGIVRGNMLKKGQERSVAERELNQLTLISRFLGQATLRTGMAASEQFVDLKLDLGQAAPTGR